jgi:pimeloyl-ACP methyl ester carboxylesterase
MKLNQLLGNKPRHFLTLLSAIFLALVTTAAVADNRGHDDDSDRDRGKAPLVIKEQGSFFVGGVKVQAPGTLDPFTPVASASDDGQIYHYDRLYAEYQIPRNPRKYNIILIHGGGGTGKVWDTTPNGDEGYKTLWLRRGFPVYTVDFPRRGRAGYPSFNGPFGELAGTPIVQNRTNRSGDQLAFVRWRLGLEYPIFFPNSKFPKSMEALDEFFSSLVPTVDSVPVINDGLVALVEKIGPSIVVTHSQSVSFGWQMAIRSSNVKGIVAYEGATASLFPPGEAPPPIPLFDGSLSEPRPEIPLADFMKLTQIPIQIVWADGISEPSPFPGVDNVRVGMHNAGEMVAAINRHGGNASMLSLPAIGIFGNTHFMFSDTNHVQIADLMSQFLRDTGLDRRTEHKDDNHHKHRKHHHDD